jgi:hypothetical protein
MKYSFNSSESVIKDIEVFNHGEKTSSIEAIIHIPDAVSTEQLQKILRNRGYDAMLGVDEDKTPVMRVYGFENANNLLVNMAKDGAVKGDYSSQETDRDNQKFVDESAKDRALKTLAGSCYIGGNTFSMLSGAVNAIGGNGYSGIYEGLAWMPTSVGLVVDGLQDADKKMSFLYSDFDHFLKKNDIKVPSNIQSILNEHKSEDGLWNSFERFATSNSSTAFACAEALGGIFGAKAGWEQNKNMYKVTASLTMVGGMIVSALLPSEANVDNNNHSPLLGRNEGASDNLVPEPNKKTNGLMDFLKTHQMVPAGGCAFTQNILKLIGTKEVSERNRMNFDGVLKDENKQYRNNEEWLLDNADQDIWKKEKQGVFGAPSEEPIAGQYYQNKKKWQNEIDNAKQSLNALEPGKEQDKHIAIIDENQKKLTEIEKKRKKFAANDKAALFDQLAVGSFMMANATTLMTKKSNSPDLMKSGGVNNIIEMAANIVLEQPEDQQKAMMQRTSTFLGDHKYVKLDIDQVVNLINEKVETLQQSNLISNTIELKQNKNHLENLYQIPNANNNETSATINDNSPPKTNIDPENKLVKRMYGEEVKVGMLSGV